MKRLFFDIETSPNIVYSWRVGYRIILPPENIIQERKIICICWKWEHKKNVYSLTWDENKDDKQLLKEFIKVCDEADEIVAHNGDKFDIKWLRTRCIYHRIDFPEKIQSFDTLKKSRKGFRFNSNKLDYIAKFLGVGEKTKTGGFDLWVDTMNGKKKALQEMVDYCKNDVIILQKVFNELEKYVEVNTHTGVSMGADRWSCVTCGSEHVRFNGQLVSKTGMIKFRMRCYDCNKGWSIAGSVYRRFLEHKYGKVKKDNTNS